MVICSRSPQYWRGYVIHQGIKLTLEVYPHEYSPKSFKGHIEITEPISDSVIKVDYRVNWLRDRVNLEFIHGSVEDLEVTCYWGGKRLTPSEINSDNSFHNAVYELALPLIARRLFQKEASGPIKDSVTPKDHILKALRSMG